MGIFSTINIASSGLTAQRTRLDVISNNLANADSTRTTEGGVFRRSRVVLSPRTDQPYWRGPFVPADLDQGVGSGVRVEQIEVDMDTDTRLVYDPTHPDAIQTGPNAGMVEYPNVNTVTEMVDMISATRSYEANLSIIDGSKSMFSKALEIGR